MVYRLDNEDIYSQVNTILKMAKKRALVDAALSAGRLSQVFTQDIEDMHEEVEPAKPSIKPATSARGEELKQKIDETTAKVQEEREQQPQPSQIEAVAELAPPAEVTIAHLKETIQLCNWSAQQVGQFCNTEKKWDIRDYKDLKPAQLAELINHLKRNPK